MKSASETASSTEQYIHTQEGRWYIGEPVWRIDSIAHALGQTARFRGNADLFYSVAEHSVLVSLLMEELNLGDPMEGLLHDAVESVLPDVSSPFKQFFPDLRKVEKDMELHMRMSFGLPIAKTDGCAKADWLALFIEAGQILPEKGEDFHDPYNLRPEAMRLRRNGWMVRGFAWDHAKGMFLSRYERLMRTRRG